MDKEFSFVVKEKIKDVVFLLKFNVRMVVIIMLREIGMEVGGKEI